MAGTEEGTICAPMTRVPLLRPEMASPMALLLPFTSNVAMPESCSGAPLVMPVVVTPLAAAVEGGRGCSAVSRDSRVAAVGAASGGARVPGLPVVAAALADDGGAGRTAGWEVMPAPA